MTEPILPPLKPIPIKDRIAGLVHVTRTRGDEPLKIPEKILDKCYAAYYHRHCQVVQLES